MYRRVFMAGLVALIAIGGAMSRHATTIRSCGAWALPGHVSCLAQRLVVTGAIGGAGAIGGSEWFGYSPADIRSAYRIPDTGTTTKPSPTVAVIDAFDNPNSERDLATYRSRFGLPPCTTANGCFRRVTQDGHPVSQQTTWATETSLDLQAVSAACPQCHLLLFEMTDDHLANLVPSVEQAERAGAQVVSLSFGIPESITDLQPGIAISNQTAARASIIASAGDGGYGVNYPAASPNVIAVGGTTLRRTTAPGRGWSETAWSGTGSGCSRYQPRPVWQPVLCGNKRSVADLAADADPTTGLTVYDSTSGGWTVVGGTSLAAPLVAGMLAVRGGGHGRGAQSLYAAGGSPGVSTFDVTTGTNSNAGCSPTPACAATIGYDGPTGIGTLNAP